MEQTNLLLQKQIPLLIGYNKPNDITVIGNESNLNNGLTVLFNIIITIDVMMAYPNELI